MSRPSLFQRLLGPDFERLPGEVQAFHAAAGAHLTTGVAEITTAPGFVPWLLRTVARLPRAGRGVPVSVAVTPTGDGRERWVRDFGGRRYASTLAPGGDQGEALLAEHLGPIALYFKLSPGAEGLRWSLFRWRLCGLALPAFTRPDIVCLESGEDGRYNFAITAAFPLVGEIIQYRGHLSPN